MKKVLYLFLGILLIGLNGCAASEKAVRKTAAASQKFIFVHGLSGWGSYDKTYKYMPYWGMRGGDLIAYLNEQGYESYAASVAPSGSAWDRACELYAQLAGTVTDYGEAHSKRCNHARFGKDYSDKPLIDSWGEKEKFVLIGHSFGGATVRLFSQLMAEGSVAERQATPADTLSDFFKGGKAAWIHSVVALAAPHNGTTAYDMHEDKQFQPEEVKVSFFYELFAKLMSAGTKADTDNRASFDYAAYDMHIDNALKLNRQIATLKNVYYFSVPCISTEANAQGNQYPDTDKTEPMFVKSAAQMGCYTGTTAGGFTIDASWQANDGLVNTVSAKAPLGAPAKDYEKGSVTPGIWNIMPVYHGDHMSLQGGLLHKNEVKSFYMDLLKMIAPLP